MANVRISQLPSPPVAINGTELLPIVQNGLTCQTTIANALSVATNVITFSGGTTGFTPSTPSTGGIVLGGTLNVASGGTGLTTLAAGSITYGAETSAFSSLAIGTSGNVITSSGTAPQYTAPNALVFTTGSLSLGGNLTTSGAFTQTFTATGNTSVTLPTSGTLLTTTGSGSSLTFGTGSLSLGGNLTTSGAFTTTFTVGANTSLTLPTSGTLISTVTNMAANPVTGTPSSTTFLRGDGTWATPLAITSVSGTTNQITASTTTGAVTLSLPTSITTGQYIANQSISGSANQGAFAYGTLNGSDTGIFASYQTSIAGYAYMALQNTSSNAAATTDIALYNDTASLSKYIDIGINSSGFTGTGNFSLANAGYIYTYGGDLALGTYSSNGIHFIINNGATDAMTINASNAIAFNGSYGTSGQILQSNGNAAAPTWTSAINGVSIGATTASTGAFTTLSATGVFTASAGTAALPSIVTASGSTTGLFSSTANVLGFAVSATQVGTVTSTGLNAMAVGATTASTGSFTTLSATTRDTAGVLASNLGLTTNTTVTNTAIYTTAGITLASQTAATGAVWRVRAYGTFVAASSATVRQAQIACFWGSTQLTVINPTVLASTAQTTGWQVEFELSATSTTAIWTTGVLTNRIASATIMDNTVTTAASTTVTAGAQTLDLRVSVSSAIAAESWVIQQVTMERLK